MATWRERITEAARGVDAAYATRRDVFQQASDAGLSLRQIGSAAGLSAATVHKIIGGVGEERISLDSEAP